LDIEGEELIAILKSVIDNKYHGINFDGELVSMTAPFSPIVRSQSSWRQTAILTGVDSQLGQAYPEA